MPLKETPGRSQGGRRFPHGGGIHGERNHADAGGGGYFADCHRLREGAFAPLDRRADGRSGRLHPCRHQPSSARRNCNPAAERRPRAVVASLPPRLRVTSLGSVWQLCWPTCASRSSGRKCFTTSSRTTWPSERHNRKFPGSSPENKSAHLSARFCSGIRGVAHGTKMRTGAWRWPPGEHAIHDAEDGTRLPLQA